MKQDEGVKMGLSEWREDEGRGIGCRLRGSVRVVVLRYRPSRVCYAVLESLIFRHVRDGQ
jgi:hypothetical protein